MPASTSRPRVVDVAFWCVVAGAILLIVGGLMAVTATFEAARSALPAAMPDDKVRSYLTIYRASGIGAILVGPALAFLTGRARSGDRRFRRAALALSLAVVVVVGMLAIGVGVAQPLLLVALLPILVGTALFTRPASRAWYDAQEPR